LTADKDSPQDAGTAVEWTAKAMDANNDPILYQFWLKGPATGNAWRIVQNWSTEDRWTWSSTPNDGGTYRIYVYVRDGKHASKNGYDSAFGQEYMLESSGDGKSLQSSTDQIADKIADKIAASRARLAASKLNDKQGAGDSAR
jgi:hypothetical protein